jgi:hypothetical protein
MRPTRTLNVLLLLLLGSLLGGTAFGAAEQVFTSKNIKDGTIQNRDIRTGVISMNRLTTGVQDLINEGGAQGPSGAPGAPGGPGAPGAPGAPGGSTPSLSSGDFGIVNRNTKGSPMAEPRTGPVSGESRPPYGSGSLNLLVGQGEKIAYGISQGGLLKNLDKVGFSVYTTGENAGRGPANMPNIQFEINPKGAGLSFATMVFVPKTTAPYKWTTIDATDPANGYWYLTRGTSCDQTTTCSLADIKSLYPDGEFLTLMINKGTDQEWQGAVDGLRVNNTVADFEEGGVIIRKA